MITILPCTQPEQKSDWIKQFRPTIDSWVVSDLQSKWHLQSTLLQQHRALEDRAVMRATELWKHLAFQLRPDLRIISVELAQSLFWSWIEPRQLQWARSPRSVQIVLEQMNQWMGIFADPQHREIMGEWFQANPEAYVRWGHWFELCAEIWAECHERNLVIVSWLPAVLLNEDLQRLKLRRKFTFDLGPQITLVEAQLIQELSALVDVTVIVPAAEWVTLLAGPLRPYYDVMEVKPPVTTAWQPEAHSEFVYKRLATQLAEVKSAVASVRRWLEAGVPAAQIAVVAPDIEVLWPTLQMYLKEEGIPASKLSTSRLGGHLDMAKWLAKLRTVAHRISDGDLELQLFSANEQPQLSFDEFRILFTHVYSPADLRRAHKLFESSQPLNALHPLPLRDYLAWALRHWSSDLDSPTILHLLQIVGQEVPPTLQLQPGAWLSYLEGLGARRDLSLEAGQRAGIWCVSLSSANWLEVTHAVVLNLCENDLRYLQNSQVAQGEARRLWNDTGFALAQADRQELEFELLWLMQRKWQALHLSYAESDFAGSVLTPSRLWIWTALANEQWQKQPQAPARTRWDEIQRLSLEAWAQVRQLDPQTAKGVALGLARDENIEVSTWRSLPQIQVSASALERYAECPFVFAAQRQLKLSDPSLLDLDMDHRTRGLLLHAILEELLQAQVVGQELRLDWTREELGDLIDTVRMKAGLQLGEEQLWQAIRAQHIRLTETFLQMEREMRERLPLVRTVGLESQFQCHWDLTTGQLTREQTSVKITGRMDRVDRDSKGRYALIDYKGSAVSTRNWSSWINQKDLQMPLYALLLESGMTELAAAPVAAANYYVVKTKERRKGYHCTDASAELYSPDDKHRNWITAEQKQELFDQTRALLNELVGGILQGDFRPRPENLRLCLTCNWKGLCRAPHLN